MNIKSGECRSRREKPKSGMETLKIEESAMRMEKRGESEPVLFLCENSNECENEPVLLLCIFEIRIRWNTSIFFGVRDLLCIFVICRSNEWLAWYLQEQ